MNLPAFSGRVPLALTTTGCVTGGVRQGLARLPALYETDEALAIDRLMRSAETLRACKKAHYERQERIVADALAERWPDPEQRQALDLVAVVGIGTLRLATKTWGAARFDFRRWG